MADEVLVVGAGPTGLTLALFLAKQGVKARIIDRNEGPGRESRAMAVQARTLEFYRQIGLDQEVVKRGIKMDRIHLWEEGKEIATLDFGGMGVGISPYPFALSFPQDEHEQILGQALSAAGVEVEWGTELTTFEETADAVSIVLKTVQGEARGECAYVCGCDGAHSIVRQQLGLEFAGGTYSQVFFVADVQASGSVANGDLNGCLSADDFYAVFPIRTSGNFRIIGIVPKPLRSDPDVTFDRMIPYLEEQLGIEIKATHWSSMYHVHHRVAEHFRAGRAFLAGDAGHIHSPAGGQGMNTGIGDAVNLAWKLASVILGKGSTALLDTYEPERITFAHSLVQSTDRAFQLGVSQGFTSRLFRTVLLPHLGPVALGISSVRKAAFGLVSQTKVNYRESALSEGKAGDLHGGDRLPWVESLDNFAPLASLAWQVHVYGENSLGGAALPFPVHVFEWCDEAERAGFEQDSMLLVRPDGYVALASRKQDSGELIAFAQRFGIG